jgi:hypothetical protein
VKKDDVIFVGVIVVGGAATGFALAYLALYGIKQESLFALIGALIGAAAAIGGAAWSADRSRALERDSEIAVLLKGSRRLLKVALAANAAEPGTNMPWPSGYRPSLLRLAEAAGVMHAIANEAFAHAKALSFVQRAAVRRLQYAIDEFLGFWTDANAEGELEPDDDRNFPAMTGALIHECKMTIAELKGAVPFADEV